MPTSCWRQCPNRGAFSLRALSHCSRVGPVCVPSPRTSTATWAVSHGPYCWRISSSAPRPTSRLRTARWIACWPPSLLSMPAGALTSCPSPSTIQSGPSQRVPEAITSKRCAFLRRAIDLATPHATSPIRRASPWCVSLNVHTVCCLCTSKTRTVNQHHKSRADIADKMKVEQKEAESLFTRLITWSAFLPHTAAPPPLKEEQRPESLLPGPSTSSSRRRASFSANTTDSTSPSLSRS
mmetsp:Transcript_11046/g.33825  ORF Transcript_11046/g.33825 Transcript_11046/m.33825 type:complete len:238 (+) Transcript_11046:690-1403(+)